MDRQHGHFRTLILQPIAGAVLVVFMVATLSGAAGCRRESPSGRSSDGVGSDRPKPNIIFVMIDTLRADRLGIHGHEGHLSPTIDEIARRALTCGPRGADL